MGVIILVLHAVVVDIDFDDRGFHLVLLVYYSY